MKLKFKMENLDCANCAAKMEELVKRIPGVNDAAVNFIMQKLTIDADDALADGIAAEAAKVCAGVEPDCRLVPTGNAAH